MIRKRLHPYRSVTQMDVREVNEAEVVAKVDSNMKDGLRHHVSEHHDDGEGLR